MALEPRGKGIIAYSLRMGDEVVSPEDAFADIPAAQPGKQMVEIARKIIEQQEGAFEPQKFEDRYETALRDLIRRKQKGEKLVTAEPVEEDNVIDLMAALKKSLKTKGGARAQRGARPAGLVFTAPFPRRIWRHWPADRCNRTACARCSFPRSGPANRHCG